MVKSLGKFALSASIMFVLTFTLSCSSDDGDVSGGAACPDTKTGDNTVTCGGKTYKTVKIGEQTWMAENLNYDASGSKCYGDSPANCTKYGKLYDWAAAMDFSSKCNSKSCKSNVSAKHRGICPSGWHIPSNADWDKLMRKVDGTNGSSSPYDSQTAGKLLKADNGWNQNNGTDDFEFTALPGGYGGSDGKYYFAGDQGSWWSTSEDRNYYAHYRKMDSKGNTATYDGSSKSSLYSIRCLQD